jgi:hypothetical protein
MTLARILAPHWRSFVAIAGTLFGALALAIIFLLPGPQVLVRSSIDIGSYFLRGQETPIYSPDPLAKRTLQVYVPLTLSAMSQEGTPLKVLNALQSSVIEATQLSIAIATTVDATAEDSARQFQERLAELILRGEMPRADALRARMTATDNATNLSNYEKQISADMEQIDRVSKRIAEIENSRRDLEAELKDLLQRQQSTGQADAQTPLQTRIRWLQDQLANQLAALTALSIQQNSFVLALGATEELMQHLAQAADTRQLDQKSFIEPRVSLPPTPILTTPQWRRTGLLAVALVVSILTAFGLVTTIANMRTRDRQC